MRNFRFDDIWILSSKQRAGRALKFHPRTNLIVGGNHTGKSTIIKMLFATLGAKPSGRLEKWDYSATTAVRFSVDDRQYRVVSDGARRALFDNNDQLIAATSSGLEWARVFASLLDFNLLLTRRADERAASADPGCFFLPFYIDQDAGWKEGWNTFKSILQFRAPVGAILDYFSGIAPPEYYRAKAEADSEQVRLNELSKELSFLKRAQARFGSHLPEMGPKIEPQNFEAEVARLTQEMTELNRQQEELRQKAAEQGDLIAMISRQIAAAVAALKEHDGDVQFMRTLPSEPLVCPVCQAQHDESYLDLLTFADDARSLRELSADLANDRDRAMEKHRQTRAEIQALDSSYRRIEELLNTRRGELVFRDIVESRGAEKAFAAFDAEREGLEKTIGESESALKEKKELMRQWSSKERKAKIIAAFKDAYAAALFDLNVPASKIAGLASRPDLSGSGGPRKVLAYQSALWSVCLGEYGAFGNPIVVDSPNQQGQDGKNLPRVLEYVSSKLPGRGQVIVGSELPIQHSFDHRIELSEPYSVLRSADYEAAEAEIGEPLRRMYDALKADTRADSLA